MTHARDQHWNNTQPSTPATKYSFLHHRFEIFLPTYVILIYQLLLIFIYFSFRKQMVMYRVCFPMLPAMYGSYHPTSGATVIAHHGVEVNEAATQMEVSILQITVALIHQSSK